MKKFLLISIFNYFVIFNIFAVTKTSISNGSWSSASTWSPSGVPVATDDVIINTNVVLDQNIDIDPGGSLTINSGGTLIGATFTIDFNGSTIIGDPVALLTNHGTITVGNILEGTECAYSKIDNYGTINVEAANGTTPVVNWRSRDTLFNHAGATFNVLNGLFRSSNQHWTECNGGAGKPTTINEGYFNLYDAQFHAGSIFMNYLIVNIEPAPAPGLWMGAWEFHNYGCILGGNFEFNSKSNNSGHNLSFFHDGSKVYANMSITSSSQTLTGVDDDGVNANNACTYSPLNITNTGTITGEFYMNDPDGVIPGTVGPSVVEGTDNCGGPACALPCDIALTVSPSTCTPSTNEYSLAGTLTFTNPPTSGTLTVSISGGGTQSFNPPFTSPQNYSISGLMSDGISHTVTAVFSADATCTDSEQYLAPSECQVRDLELSKSVDKSLVCIGDTLTYTIVVTNTGNVSIAAISVKDTLPDGLIFVTSSATQGTYSNVTKIWTVGTINTGSSATLTVLAIATTGGLMNNTAQISAMSGTDVDSTPDNNDPDEDDLDKVCVAVKIPICPGDSYTVTIPGSPSSIVWYKDGVVISGATSASYTITTIGTYTYTYTNSGCPEGSCCPIEVIEDEHCCMLNSLNVTTACDNNGTPTNPADDMFDIMVNPNVIDGGTCYNVIVSGTIGGLPGTRTATCLPYGEISIAALGLPIAGTNGLTITITDSDDAQCLLSSSVTVPSTCSNQTTCEVVVMYTQDACDDNGTTSITTDDWFIMDFSASAINGGANNLFEVVLNANPDGTGGTVLNPGGTTYGMNVTIGTPGQFLADSLSRYNITVRDFNDNTCHHDFLTQVVGSCSSVSCTLSATCTPTPQSNCTPENGGVSVAVTGGQGTISYLWSSGETTSSISGKASGTYTVTVTDDVASGCTATCLAVITNTTIIPPVTCAKVDNTNCTTPNGSATATATGVTYAWSNGGTTATISNLSAGTYTMTVTNTTTGCTNTCQSIVGNATVTPTCSITVNNQPSCAILNGGSVTVVPSPAGTYSYVWNTGATTATVNNLPGGTYMVTVTNTSTSCTGVCQVTLDTPTNCCNINTITIQSLECLDNGTPNLMTDNRLRIGMVAYNSNTSLTTYTVTVNGGTTITPTTGTYGTLTYFTLGPGTGGTGATYTVTLTDSVTPGCTSQVQVVSPIDCAQGTGNPCQTPNCGTATIQVNNN